MKQSRSPPRRQPGLLRFARNDGVGHSCPPLGVVPAFAGTTVEFGGVTPSDSTGPYSAASRISTRSALAAQNLNSGILPNGSSAGLVKRFAAASA